MEELDGLLEGGELAAVNAVAGYFFPTALVTTGVFDRPSPLENATPGDAKVLCSTALGMRSFESNGWVENCLRIVLKENWRSFVIDAMTGFFCTAVAAVDGVSGSSEASSTDASLALEE